MTEPVPVDLALKAVARAIRECDAAWPGPRLAAVSDLARAGFRGTLEYLQTVMRACEKDELDGVTMLQSAAIRPIIAHYDRVSPGWRTE